MQYVSHKPKAWVGLPLTLVGFINIFYMILLLNHFDALDSLLTPFLYGNQMPRLGKDALKALYEKSALSEHNMYSLHCNTIVLCCMVGQGGFK